MLFWVSLGLFVGLTALSFSNYRRELASKGPLKALAPTTKDVFNFAQNDQILIREKHYFITSTTFATDGVKRFHLAELDSSDTFFVCFFEDKQIIFCGLCQLQQRALGYQNDLDGFQVDGVAYTTMLHTRVKTEKSLIKQIGSSPAFNINLYQNENKRFFRFHLDDEDFALALTGDALQLEEVMVLASPD